MKTLSIQQGFVNRPVERYHNEIREKLKSRRGLGNQKSAQIFAELYKIRHNFVKPHQGLNGKTPAEAAGIDLNLGDDKYLDLIKLAINHKNKTHDISKQLGNRTNLVEIINEKDSTRVVQKEWIKKKTWREIIWIRKSVIAKNKRNNPRIHESSSCSFHQGYYLILTFPCSC